MSANRAYSTLLAAFGILLGGGCAGVPTKPFVEQASGPVSPGQVRIEVERSSAFTGAGVGGYVMDYPASTTNGWLNIYGGDGRVAVAYLEVDGEPPYNIWSESRHDAILRGLKPVLAWALQDFSIMRIPEPTSFASGSRATPGKGDPVHIIGRLGPGGVLSWERPAGPMMLQVVVNVVDWINGRGKDWRVQTQEIQTEPGQVYRYYMDFELGGPTLELRAGEPGSDPEQ